MNRHAVKTLFTIAGIGLLLPGIASPVSAQGQAKMPRKQAKHPLFMQIGDVKISGYRSVGGKADFSSVILRGPKTLIVVPDKKNKSTLTLHADVIRMAGANNNIGTVDLTGHVRYTILRDDPDGASTLDGTAGTGHYQRNSHKIALTEGVDALLTDPTHLNGPGTFHGEQVTVDMGEPLYRYHVEGSADTNAIRFTPHSKEGTAQIGQIYVHRYLTGDFQMGQTARFDGPVTTIEMSTTTAKTAVTTQMRLQAQHVTTEFAQDKRTLNSAEASGNVSYHVSQPAVKKNVMHLLTGVCGRAIWDAPGKTVTLQGNIDAQITAPDALQEPATVKAERVVASMEAPYRYEISGNPARNAVEFIPLRPKPRPTAQPIGANVTSPPPTNARGVGTFALGHLSISGFDTGTYATDTEITFAGDGTTFLSSDPVQGSLALLQASHFTGTLAADHTLERTDAVGNVRFFFQQTAATTKAVQTVKGTGTRAVFTTTQERRDIEVRGPLTAEVVDPVHLAEPGHLSSEADGILTLTQTPSGYDFDLNTENETGKIDFVPLPAAKKAPTAPTGKPKKLPRPIKPQGKK